MRKHAHLVILLALAALAAIFAAGIGALSREPFTPRRRLADGSLLTLEGVTVGSQSEVVLGGWWQKLLYPVLPQQYRAGLRCSVYPDGKWFTVTGPGTLVFWTRYQSPHPRNLPGGWFEGVITDEHGCKAEMEAQADLGPVPVGGVLQAWRFPAFPRRGKTTALRLYGRDRSGQPCAAEFVVANPAPPPAGGYPSWKPQPLPAARSDGGLTVTLTRLVTRVGPGDPPRPVGPDEMPYTRATFRVTRNGQPEEGWQPIGLTLADACGNRWTPELFPDSGTRGEVTCVFRGELWPDEPAWKLRATLHRMDHFTPEELWTVVGVEAPRPGTVVRSKITARRQGASLRLLGIVGQGALMSGGSLTTIPSVESCATVQVREEGSVKGLRVNLFRATDERGRSVTRTFTFTDGKVHVFGMNALPPVKRLNLTFSVHRTHTVEFVVKPAYP